MRDEHRANRMDRLVPVQALSPESVQRVPGEVKPLGELILNDGVNGCVELGIRQFRARPAVIRRDQVESLRLSKREPLMRVRRCHGIVFHHTPRDRLISTPGLSPF